MLDIEGERGRETERVTEKDRGRRSGGERTTEQREREIDREREGDGEVESWTAFNPESEPRRETQTG